MTVMHVPYGGEVDIEPVGVRDCQLRVRYNEHVVLLIIPDCLLKQLVEEADRYLDRRAAERTLALLEAERERRRAKEKAAEATAADAVIG